MIYAPREVYLPYGKPALLDCHFRANPPLTNLRWEKDGFLFDPYNVQGVFYRRNGSLYFSKVDETHSGSYSCTPYNELGTEGPSPSITVVSTACRRDNCRSDDAEIATEIAREERKTGGQPRDGNVSIETIDQSATSTNRSFILQLQIPRDVRMVVSSRETKLHEEAKLGVRSLVARLPLNCPRRYSRYSVGG